MIEGHGDDAWKYNFAIKADFSSNVLYGELDKGLQAHLREKIASVTHYPEAGAQTLQAEAARAFGLTPDQVLATNGATEAIYLAAQAFRHKKTATILTPAFVEYEDACRLHGLDIGYLPADGLTPATSFHASLVFCCNPNNPTGVALPSASLRQLIHDHPATLFVVDESYITFTAATQSLVPFLADHPNLLILRSLTKSCRIPGLRIGFALGHEHLIRQLQAGKMPWSVNRLAIEAALYILRHPQPFALPLDQLLAATVTWQQQLRDATGWRVHPTDTHYFLVETGGHALPSDRRRPSELGARPTSAATLKQHLLQRYGLLIRDASNFRGLTPYHFRVACQSPEHNQLLTYALQECIHTGI